MVRWLLLLSFALVTRLMAAAAYEFELNGEPVSAHITSLAGAPESPGPGDVAYVGGFSFVLDEPGRYVLRRNELDARRLYRVTADGQEALLACVISEDASKEANKDAERICINPLDGLPLTALTALRGVRIEAWRPAAGAQLKALDLSRCLLSLKLPGGPQHDFTLQSIPAGLRYLDLDEPDGEGRYDLTPLGALKELIYLEHFSRAEEYDLAILEALHALRFLQIGRSSGRVAHSEALGNLRELRSLDLAGEQGLRDVSFVRPLAQLRRLDVAKTQIEDLRALEHLPHIAVVKAAMSRTARLPERAVPSLRELDLLGTPIDEKALAVFQEQNPKCEVAHNWDAVLRKALAETDRVRVVSSGFDRESPRGKMLAEETKAAAIEELTAAFAVDEETEPFHCMCVGSPWLEFYRGQRLLATLAVQHGFAIRWSGGWPGDRQLIPRGQDALSEWLARRGIRGPKMELAEKRERERSEERRMEVIKAIVPPKVLESLAQAGSAEAAAAAFNENLPDMPQRAEIYLRLFGSDFGSWSHSDQWDDLLKTQLLPGVRAAILAEVKLEPNQQAVNGLGRWLFFERKWADWKPAELEKVLAIVAHDGLTHPRDRNRRKTIIALGEIGTPTARQLLRSLLRGQLPPRALPEDAGAEAGAWVTYTPEPDGLPGNCSDAAHAAIWLARLGDAESKPELQKLLTTLKGEEQGALQQALAGKTK